MRNKKKYIVITLILALTACLFAGCSKKEEIKEETPVEVIQEDVEVIEDNAIKPIDFVIDLENVGDQMLSVSFDKDSFFYGPDETLLLELVVYDYEQFDSRDVNELKEGDVISLLDEDIVIETIDALESGDVMINGDLEFGGHILRGDVTGMFHEIVENDHKKFYEVGNISLSFSDDFVFVDDSDLDNMGLEYDLDDFLAEEPPFFFNFSPLNTTVCIKDGKIVEIHRIYIP